MEVTKLGPEIRPANDWIRGSKKRPIPRALFGEFWREGETAVLFADTGKGKSALAMQIAEAIASGKRIGPLEMGAGRQKVLYLDLEMNEKQFETRYATDHDGGRARFLHKHYIFSDNLYREELDPADFWVRGTRTCDVFCQKVRQLVNKSKASVVVIDSITSLKRSYYGSRETLDMINGLKRLQKELNISILALVQTPRRTDSMPLTSNDLLGLRILCGRADSVFGIGQSRSHPMGRYIKRVRAVGQTIDFDPMHVPTFRLKKIGGNFLGFEFDGFAPEIELVSDIRDHREWETIERIKQLSDNGKMSIRDIAAEIDLPKTTVHRLLQMWRPPVQEAEAVAAAAAEFDPTKNKYYFPGREEYNEALADPKFNKMYEAGDEEDWALRREYGMIDNARARAGEEYKKTGKAPTLAEMLERMREAETAASPPDQSEPGAIATGFPASDGGEAAESSSELHGKPAAFRTSNGIAETFIDNPIGIPNLKHRLDAYDKDIWVETEDYRGKPVIWYKLDSNGKKQRLVRDANGVEIERME